MSFFPAADVEAGDGAQGMAVKAAQLRSGFAIAPELFDESFCRFFGGFVNHSSSNSRFKTDPKEYNIHLLKRLKSVI